MTLLTRLRALLQRRRVARELDDELAFHVEMETQANIARGMAPADARRARSRASAAWCRQRNRSTTSAASASNRAHRPRSSLPMTELPQKWHVAAAFEAKARWHREQAQLPLKEKVRILLELQRQDLPLVARQRELKPWERPWPIDP
jgi:hypothetical protein